MEFKNITSLQNPKIKDLVRLRDSKERERTGLTLIDGVREIRRAIEANVNFEELFLCRDILGDFEEFDIVKKFLLLRKPIYEASKEVFEKIIYGNRNEGVIAVCKQPHKTFKDILLKKDSLIVVVEEVEKPGNLGAILRSCDGGGVTAVIVSNCKTDLYNPNVIRSSIGTVFNVMTISSDNQKALAYLKENKIKIVATIPDGKKNYTKIDYKKPTAIVLGSEEAGLSNFWIVNADEKVNIPMLGKADSLNVSATAAVLTYEALRQKTE